MNIIKYVTNSGRVGNLLTNSYDLERRSLMEKSQGYVEDGIFRLSEEKGSEVNLIDTEEVVESNQIRVLHGDTCSVRIRFRKALAVFYYVEKDGVYYKYGRLRIEGIARFFC